MPSLLPNGCNLLDFVIVLPIPPQTERRRGVLHFVGATEFAPGIWAGVELFGSTGRNNGSVMGRSYFTCAPGQGVFVRPELVVPFVSDASVGRGVGDDEVVQDIDSVSKISGSSKLNSVLHAEKLQENMAQMQAELKQKEGELLQAQRKHSVIAALLAERTAELENERVKNAQAFMANDKLQEAMKTEMEKVIKGKDEMSRNEVMELNSEIQRLQALCAELKEFCDLQEQELQRQKDHADDLTHLIQDMRHEHESELTQMQEKILLLEKQAEEERQIASDAKLAAERAEEVDLERLKLEAFQEQQAKEALRLLKQRYEKLHNEMEREREEYKAKLRQTTADYEAALTQQREYKDRLIDDLQQLRQKMETMKEEKSCERMLQAPLSALEREEYDVHVSKLQWELMQAYGKVFAKRYDHFVAPFSVWDMPVELFGDLQKAISSTERMLPFTSPEFCRESRKALFQKT